jgi:hypothetical protein
MKGTRVRWRSDGEYLLSIISDLSLGGVFIHTPKPAPVGTALSLLLDVPSSAIQASAIVRRSVLGQGMGVEFESMASDDQARLASLLRATDAPKAQKKARNIDHEHRESVVAAPPFATTLQERVLEDPNSNSNLRMRIQPDREQDGPGLGDVEPNPSGGGSGTLGDAGTDLRRSRRVCMEIPVGILR